MDFLSDSKSRGLYSGDDSCRIVVSIFCILFVLSSSLLESLGT